ncbi:MAG TPA: VWA domain-containing protein [Terriglobales bacterium]|nr:VWA domain-containing protein [Terriglobales bacterium]
MWKYALTVLIFFCLASLNLSGQTSPASNDETPTIRTTTREVVLDVVVRDKHHHAVSDIRPDEIQVFEDGVRQKIRDFRNVQGVEQLQTEQNLEKSNLAVNAPGKPAAALRELNFVSIVLAQIAPLNREFAREALQEFLKSDTLPNTYVTIYRLDPAPHVVQPYTADKATLMRSANAAAMGVSRDSGLGTTAQTASSISTGIQANAATVEASSTANPATAMSVEMKIINPIPNIVTDPLWARNAASQDASLALGNALVAQAQLSSGLRFADSLSNGMDAMDALRQIITTQAKLPGRKVVLYLSDGLTLPMDRRQVVSDVIGYANQMEVSFYMVDTRGLSVDDPMATSLADQQRAGIESSVNKISPRMGHMEDDDIQLANSSNKQLAMEELSEATGGFAVVNTNQIALPMQRVMEDIRTHYEVAYAPSETNFDGHFRKIDVHIDRPHVEVQTRSGYFAVPDINGVPLQPFEMQALQAINARPAPVNFPYEASLLRFRPKATSVDYQMAFDIPIPSLEVVMEGKTGKGTIRASVLALIHKPDGEVVGKVSRDLVREVTKAELPSLGGKDILYTEPIELPGGHYLIDTAVTDEQAAKTTVKRLSVFVNSGTEFGLSSLHLVRMVKPLPAIRNTQDPFETDSAQVVPTLADSVSPGKPIGVYFVVYPLSTSSVTPKITLQLFHDGKEIGRQALNPPKQQADGSIPMLLQISPESGKCDMVVTAEQGNLRAEANLSLKVGSSEISRPN